MPTGILKFISAHRLGLILFMSLIALQLPGQNCATGNLSDCGDIPSPSLIPTGNSSFCLGANSSFEVSFSDPAFIPDEICVEVSVPADPTIVPVQYSVSNANTFSFSHTFQFNPTNSCTGSQTVNFFLTAYAIVNCPGGQSVSSIILPVSARKLPNASFGLPEDSVCTFEDVFITDLFCPNASSAQYTWNWGDGSPIEVYATETLPQHQFPGPGIYTITHQIQQLGAQACGSHTASRTITVFPHARVDVFGPDTVCSGQQFLPMASAVDIDSLVYSFSPASGSFISNPEVLNPNMVLNSAVETSFDLNLQGYGCCNGDSAVCDQTFTIQVLPAPSASPLNNSQFCLPATGGVQINPLSLFNINNPQGIITGAQWTFTGGTPATASGLNPGMITYNTTGNYTIQLSLLTAGNACNASSAVSFSVINTPPQPIIEFSTPPFCEGDSVFMRISNPVAQINYVWSGPNGYSFTGISDTLLNVQAAQAGDYTVTAGPAGCSSTNTATLTIDQGPLLQIEPVGPLCQGDTLELIVSGGTSYLWSASPFISALNNDTVRVWPPSSSTFSVQSQSAAGCPGQASVNVMVLNLPVVTLSAPSPVCSGSGNQQLTGSPQQGTLAGDAALYGGPGVNLNGSFPTNTTGSFEAFYVYTSPSGCSDTAFAMVDIIDPPVANAGADISGICINEPAFMLTGTGSAPGNWQVISGLLQANGMFNPAQDGVFEAIYEIGSGSCYASDTASITVNALPNIQLINNDFELCANEGNIQLTSLPATGVIWSGPGVDFSGLFSPAAAGQGQHTIVVSITDVNLCTNSDAVIADVLGFPDAAFSISDVFACEQQQISFIPAVAGLDTYNWSFGDGSFSFQDTSFHSYNPGNFQVTLEVISGICRDTVIQSLQVQQLPQAALSITDNTLCPNQELVFGNNSTGVYQQLSWLVNNLQISTSPTGGNFLPTPSECADSVYTLTLQLADSTCGIISAAASFTVYAPPQAIVAMNPVVTEICPTTPVTFINNGCNPSVNLSWDFGFGPTAVGTNPAPVFFPDSTEEIAWPVVLTAQDIYNCGLTRDTLLVTVNPNNINININLSSSSVCLGDTVFLDNNSSSFSGINCFWQFGDNTQTTACQPEYHIYSQVGTFVIRLNQTNACYTSEDSVAVEVQPVPSVSFNYEPGPHCAGEAIGFTAQSNPPGLIVTWDFGDSASPAGNQLDYSFDTSGVFLVSARVQDGPACAATASQQVLVDYLPSAGIQADAINLCPGDPIALNATDNSGNALFNWSFGDGFAENGAEVTHAFSNPNVQPATFTVVLTAGNLQGSCFSSDSVQVQVYPSTNAAFNLPGNLFCQQGNDPLVFTPDNLAQNASSYVWWLNNSEFSNAFEPSVSITSPGTYTLKMKAENIFSCPDSAETIFEVQPAPVADFILNRTFFCEGETLILKDQSQGNIVAWFWNSGNFLQEGSAVDSTVLGLAGTYSVLLIVRDQNGCRDTLIEQNAYTVYPSPVANFTVTPSEIEVLNPEYFVNSFAQFNDFCSYEISDQDGVIDSCNFSSVLEDKFQEFLTIVQTVTNIAGCEDKMIKNIRILPDFVLTAPTIFTPNGDGQNDVFKPILVNVSEEGFELLIFDRRGNIVFQTNSISDVWDGTLLGSDWNQADRMEYEIYMVKMKGRSIFNGQKREYDGKVKLVREGK